MKFLIKWRDMKGIYNLGVHELAIADTQTYRGYNEKKHR